MFPPFSGASPRAVPIGAATIAGEFILEKGRVYIRSVVTSSVYCSN